MPETPSPAPNPVGIFLILALLTRLAILPMLAWIRRRWREEFRSPPVVQPAGGAARGGRGTVLVADDEPHIVRLVEINLQRAGYTAITTTDWEEVLPKARAQRPDLFVLDVFMPRRKRKAWEGKPTGCELVRAMRAHPSLAEIPIILMAARSADARNPLPCKELLADDVRCIFKPFNPAELLSIINQLIRTGSQPP